MKKERIRFILVGFDGTSDDKDKEKKMNNQNEKVQDTKLSVSVNFLITFLRSKCKQKLNIDQNRKKSAEKFGAYIKSAYLCSVLLK